MATYAAQSCGHGYLCSSIMWAWLLVQLNHVGMATYAAQRWRITPGVSPAVEATPGEPSGGGLHLV